MGNKIFILLLTTLSLFAMTKKQTHHTGGVDDWDYNATIMQKSNSKMRNLPMNGITTAAAPMMKVSTKSMGFSVGGAKDADNFYQNLKNSYLPKLKSITYEGVFYDHYFDSTTNGECKDLFCPSYTTTTRRNLYTQDDEYFVRVGLDSNIKESDFKRKKLNIVVVLDISGSMSSPFNRYYYDNKKANDPKSSKMDIANRSLVGMIDHLGDDDRLGVVLFDNQAYNAKPLRAIKDTDIKAIKRHILELKSRGGTNWSAGYRSGIKLFETIEEKLKNPNEYENRVIFLTDAMPNRGELREDGLFGLVKDASKRGIYTTFIGVGVDFNNDLVESISKTRGANYFAVHSDEEFLKRMDEEFDYMVTPLVFDLKLRLVDSTNKIEAVYGSPDANRATGEIMYVNTLFPTPTKDGKSKGGVILLKVKEPKDMKLEVSYKDRVGNIYKNSKRVTFKDSNDKSIKKAILLSDYVTLMQNFLLDSRQSCNDKVERSYDIVMLKRRCLIYPPDQPNYKFIKTWERRSCPLKVGKGYKKLFAILNREFKEKTSQFMDDDFKKEIEAIDILLNNSSKVDGSRIDDWNSRR
jgi:Ca-activated chloride channel family protein